MTGIGKPSIYVKVGKVVDSVSNWILYICLIIMAIMTVADALLRSFTDLGVGGLAEASTYLLVLVGFLGISRTQALGGHISVTFLTDRFPQSLKYYVKQGVGAVLILFSLLFVYAGTLKSISAFMTRESDWFGTYIIPVWFFRFAVPIGFSLFIIEVLIGILKTRADYKNRGNLSS